MMGLYRYVITAFLGMSAAAVFVGMVGWLTSAEMVASFGSVANAETPYRSIVRQLRRESETGSEMHTSLLDTKLSEADRLRLQYRARNSMNTMSVLLRAGDAVVSAVPADKVDDGAMKALRTTWLETQSAFNRWSAGVEKALALHERWEATGILAPDVLMARLLDFRGSLYQTVASLNAAVFADDTAGIEAIGSGGECDFGVWLDECRNGGGDNAVLQRIANTASEPHRLFHAEALALAERVRSGDGDNAVRIRALESTVDAAHALIGHIDELAAEVKRSKTLYDDARRYTTTELEVLFADALRSLNSLDAARQAVVDAATAAHTAASARRTAFSRWLVVATLLLAVGLAASLGWAIRSRRIAGTGSLSKKPILLNETARRFHSESSMLLRNDATDQPPVGDLPAASAHAAAVNEPDAHHGGSADRVLAPAARSPRNLPPGRKRPRPPVRPRHGKWLKGANGEVN